MKIRKMDIRGVDLIDDKSTLPCTVDDGADTVDDVYMMWMDDWMDTYGNECEYPPTPRICLHDCDIEIAWTDDPISSATVYDYRGDRCSHDPDIERRFVG